MTRPPRVGTSWHTRKGGSIPSNAPKCGSRPGPGLASSTRSCGPRGKDFHARPSSRVSVLGSRSSRAQAIPAKIAHRRRWKSSRFARPTQAASVSMGRRHGRHVHTPMGCLRRARLMPRMSTPESNEVRHSRESRIESRRESNRRVRSAPRRRRWWTRFASASGDRGEARSRCGLSVARDVHRVP
jgi:hypothetical protein